jgi:hypothetical protein
MESGHEPSGSQSPYYLAARYQEASVSQEVYTKAQKLLADNACDVSAYRFLRPNVLELPWYVVFLGERPEEALHQQFVEVFQEGTPTDVPPEVLLQLLERRAQKAQKGPWVEHHYAVTIKRKEKKTKKPRGKRKKR